MHCVRDISCSRIAPGLPSVPSLRSRTSQSRGPFAFVVLLAIVVLALFGCSGHGSSPGASQGGATGKQFEEIMGYDWSVPAGTETYFCVYKTITTDLWISDFRPVFPPGTHHVTLAFQDPGAPDGVVASTDTTANPQCNGVAIGTNLLYFAGVGTNEIHLPDGVATKVAAGKQLFLSLHLFNTTATQLKGHSGVEVVHSDPAVVVHQAEVIAAGKFQGLTVPLGQSTQTGTCTMQDDVTLLSVAPHMHLMGTHLKTTVTSATGPVTTLFDKDYQFEQQPYSILTPTLPLKKGDQLQVECSYNNTGTTTLTFGESTNQNEMCILFAYRYPAIATNLVCSQ